MYPDDLNNYDPSETIAFVEKTKRSLAHYGTPRHSGRYPYGSGENPYQHELDFIGHVHKLRERGIGDTAIAKSMSMSTTEFRQKLANADAKIREYNVSEAHKLVDKGMSKSAVARRMGVSESTVRSWLNDDSRKRMTKTAKNAELLKSYIDNDQFGYIDVTSGVEHHLGLTKHSLGNAIKMLTDQGYETHSIYVEQQGTGHRTTIKVITPPGVTKSDVYKNMDKIKLPFEFYSEDGGQTIRKIEPPVSIDPKRVQIKYAEEGGKDKDGLIELRRNVDDISLGRANYAQVRIAVDGTHYLKGMAVYADDLPPGIDIRFNTNKPKGTPMINKEDKDHSVLKPMKDDPDNPFGASIKWDDDMLTRAQRHYIGKDGKEHQSALNIVKEEGDVDEWSKTLASQFLSKQLPSLAKQQLDIAYKNSRAEMDEILEYNNPLIRSNMLEDFARRVDADAVDLSAAALPRQRNKFILPLTNTKDTEIYAPGYKDGEQIALIRYPHGGIFEIPVLTVNNKNKEAQKIMGDAIDAVGINSTVAARLSGADFDGDTVLCIPVDHVNIKATGNKRPAAYKSLEDFDPGIYHVPGHKMTDTEKGLEMGKVTNLITDMTMKGAPDEDICRAVKQSMVVIDAQKHEYDWRKSADDFGISELKEKWQGGPNAGANTLISRSTSPIRIKDRKLKAFSKMTSEEKERYYNGEDIWVETHYKRTRPKVDRKLLTAQEKKDYDEADKLGKRLMERKFKKEGKMVYNTEEYDVEVKKGSVIDPRKLANYNADGSYKYPIEGIYTEHAVKMHELAREARKLARQEEEWVRDPEMTQQYSEEVKSLRDKIAIAQRNAPLERQAQLIAGTKLRSIFYDHPEMDEEHRSRERGRQLDYARKAVGAHKKTIGSKENPLTDKEWEAITKHAVSKSMLSEILKNADKGRIKELALPKSKTTISSAKLAQAKSMRSKGYSRAEICEILDISESALLNAIGKENW